MASVTINDNPRSPSARARSALAQGDPFVPRMLLGRRLRELREAARLSRRDAGRRLHGSESRITRLELGRTAARPADVARLLAVYGADGDERTLLLALAEQTNARAWWQDDGDIVSRWVRPYLSAEQAAKLVRTFESQYVPGLLQTEDYARAVIRRASPSRRSSGASRSGCGGSASCGAGRARSTCGSSSTRRRCGARSARPATMRDQIRHIVEMCARPNVTVQIAPYGISGRVGCEGPLTLVRFPQQGLQDMVYLERPDNAHYPARRAEIERYWHVFNTLVTEAAPPERTPHILAEMLTTY
ncbi:helix-turn-helix domain-containing protein [Actinomadura madurae]|nr:helix-turn-helix transcriptional regulator [Actinomadura madurae]MCQ0018971.1 helix-turn-helix domain-containing protein [Actinomadura madurae]